MKMAQTYDRISLKNEQYKQEANNSLFKRYTESNSSKLNEQIK